MAFGKYGVVRNNWYKLTLGLVKGPVTWFPDIDNPGPGDPDPDDSYRWLLPGIWESPWRSHRGLSGKRDRYLVIEKLDYKISTYEHGKVISGLEPKDRKRAGVLVSWSCDVMKEDTDNVACTWNLSIIIIWNMSTRSIRGSTRLTYSCLILMSVFFYETCPAGRTRRGKQMLLADNLPVGHYKILTVEV